jgi:hypothetical protein
MDAAAEPATGAAVPRRRMGHMMSSEGSRPQHARRSCSGRFRRVQVTVPVAPVVRLSWMTLRSRRAARSDATAAEEPPDCSIGKRSGPVAPWLGKRARSARGDVPVGCLTCSGTGMPRGSPSWRQSPLRERPAAFAFCSYVGSTWRLRLPPRRRAPQSVTQRVARDRVVRVRPVVAAAWLLKYQARTRTHANKPRNEHTNCLEPEFRAMCSEIWAEAGCANDARETFGSILDANVTT